MDEKRKGGPPVEDDSLMDLNASRNGTGRYALTKRDAASSNVLAEESMALRRQWASTTTEVGGASWISNGVASPESLRGIELPKTLLAHFERPKVW